LAWHFAASGGWGKPLYDCGGCCKTTGSRLRPRPYNCKTHHPEDYDTLSEQAWWSAEYQTEKGERYYPDNFRWPECPVSTLTGPHAPGFDPVSIVELIGEARRVGGRGAVFAISKRDARLYDAAAVIEQCRDAERSAAMKAIRK
jgi:hypothetical protein